MEPHQSQLKNQGLAPGKCSVRVGDNRALACHATLKEDQRGLHRLISAVHLSRPENYLTIYQSGCNLACRKCHSWYFTKVKEGRWYSPQDILQAAKDYDEKVTLFEPRERATAWHAQKSCRCCGACVIHGGPADCWRRNRFCLAPRDLDRPATLWPLPAAISPAALNFTPNAPPLSKPTPDYGPSSKPVLRNAEYIGRFAKNKLWEYRILVIPKINEEEIEPLCGFIADIDADLPVCFLAFRPNYVLEQHPGATAELMDRCVNIAKKSGLNNAYWTGQTGIPGSISAPQNRFVSAYQMVGVRLAGAYAYAGGCRTHGRNCGACDFHQTCPVKRYIPQIQT